jgi:hypothetical protein
MAETKIYDALVRIEYEHDNEYGDSRRAWSVFMGEWISDVPLPAMITKIAAGLEEGVRKRVSPDHRNPRNFIVTNYTFEEAKNV